MANVSVKIRAEMKNGSWNNEYIFFFKQSGWSYIKNFSYCKFVPLLAKIASQDDG